MYGDLSSEGLYLHGTTGTEEQEKEDEEKLKHINSLSEI